LTVAFAEDVDLFIDVDGFAVPATLAGSPVDVIFDAPGAEVLDGSVATTEPSVLVKAADAPTPNATLVMDAGDLPDQLSQHAGAYKVRTTLPEPPDGAFVRCFLARTA
jgi:hypothetical protein